MTNTELLTRVKNGMLISGTSFDDALTMHIEEVKFYLADAGISKETIDSEKSVGIITRGVSDLFTNETPTLSNYFHERVAQMVLAENKGGES